MAAMIRVTIGNTTSSQSVIVPSDKKISELFKEYNIPTVGCTVSLNSQPVADQNKTLAQLNAAEDSFLFAVFNSKNA